MEIDINLIEKAYRNKPGRYMGEHKDYAILIPVIKMEYGTYILFEERSTKLLKQPGEICFPGGKIEEDEDAEAAVIRETCEELEINREDISIIAKGDKLHRYANVNIYSYIGTVSPDIEFHKINNSEVEKVHLIKLEKLMKAHVDMYYTKIGPLDIEGFPYDKIGAKDYSEWIYRDWEVPIIKCEDITIWGLTAKFLIEFLKRLDDKG
jgi:8-oxo-dGTP pyrophosphatase MutT (NUDIX family)